MNSSNFLTGSSNETLARSSEIPDNEELYRGVLDDELFFPVDDVNGGRRISLMAFSDRTKCPSVDIASLCGNDPLYTSLLRGPGVLCFTAGQVRLVSATKADTTYYADVRPDPTVDNPAHGVIYGKPPFDNDKLFRRIKEALAREARWVIKPGKCV